MALKRIEILEKKINSTEKESNNMNDDKCEVDEYSIAIEYLKGKSFNKALSIFEKLIIEKPKSFEILNNIGLCYLGQNIYDRALEYFERALKLNKYFSQARINKGITIYYRGASEAIQNFQEVINSNPDNFDAYYNSGIIFYNLNLKSEAKKYWEIAYTLNSDDEKIKK